MKCKTLFVVSPYLPFPHEFLTKEHMSRYKKGEWNGKYQKILIYAEKGLAVKDIAEKVGMHEKTVYRIMQRDSFVTRQEELHETATEEARKLLASKTVEAAEQLIRILKRGKSDDRIKLDAAKEILFRAGVNPVERIETVNRNYTPDEVASAAKAALEVKGVVDALSVNPSRFLVNNEDTPKLSPEPQVEQGETSNE